MVLLLSQINHNNNSTNNSNYKASIHAINNSMNIIHIGINYFPLLVESCVLTVSFRFLFAPCILFFEDTIFSTTTSI